MATLFFDLDGTLIDVRRRHYGVYAKIMLEMGMRPLPGPVYWDRRREGEGTLSIAGDLSAEMRERFSSAWIDRIERPGYLKLDNPYDGALQTLEALKLDHDLVLITLRRDHRALLQQLECTGLAPYFGQRVYSTGGSGTVRKVELAARLTFDDENVWVIGDTEADTELAAFLHANCLCLTDGVRSAAFLRERGGRLFASSLRALPGLVAARTPV